MERMMKDFKKENFDYSGGYLTYEGKFVARFKYGGPITMAKFKNFLILIGKHLSFFWCFNRLIYDKNLIKQHTI